MADPWRQMAADRMNLKDALKYFSEGEIQAMIDQEAERCVGDLPQALTGYEDDPELGRRFVQAVIKVLERKLAE